MRMRRRREMSNWVGQGLMESKLREWMHCLTKDIKAPPASRRTKRLRRCKPLLSASGVKYTGKVMVSRRCPSQRPTLAPCVLLVAHHLAQLHRFARFEVEQRALAHAANLLLFFVAVANEKLGLLNAI